MKKILSDMKCDMSSPMVINEDNQAAMSIAKNPIEHSKTKHIDIKFNFIRDQILNEKILHVV